MAKHRELTGPDAYRAELRDTIVRSSLTGVAATFLAVTLCSPAGLGGLVGTTWATLGFDSLDPDNTGETVVTFPVTPPPISAEELQTIRGRLAGSVATLDNIRASTDAQIEYMRGLSVEAAEFVVTVPRDIIAKADPSPVAETVDVALAEPTPVIDRDLELAALLVRPESGS